MVLSSLEVLYPMPSMAATHAATNGVAPVAADPNPTSNGGSNSLAPMKYIVVTGGVVSGLGKGVTISSIGRMLKNCGLRTTSIKIDPYLVSHIRLSLSGYSLLVRSSRYAVSATLHCWSVPIRVQKLKSRGLNLRTR